MNEKKYLNEERYEKNKKKVLRAAYLVLAVGLLLGCGLVGFGIMRQVKINGEYSEESKEKYNEELEELRTKLENRRIELENSGVKYSEFANYTDKDEYELKVITKVMDPSFDYCNFDEYKNNVNTKEYCNLKNKIADMNDDFNKKFDSFTSIPFYMFGGFAIVASFMAFTSIYAFAKRREITAFTTQQVMPVAKEGMDEVSPNVGKMAKEIAKGIKAGINEADNENKR